MNRRQITSSILVSLALTLLCVFFVDQPVAAFVQKVDGRSCAILLKGTSFLEVISGFPLGKYALTYGLLTSGLILLAWKSTRSAARMLLFIGSAQCATRLIAGTLKTVFERLRPFEVIQAGDWDWKFFGGHGNSFPSGHSAHFWGLYFPLVYLFPRYRLPLAIIPLFISVARVGVNDHWCSDVIGSIAIAAAVTLLFIWLFRIKQVQTTEPSVVISSRGDRTAT
jgi:membrane-associated phospholipid phosphatase